MRPRQPVPGDHLRKGSLALHQFRQPRAAGSTDTAAIVGDDADRSTTTTLALRANRRASVSAVNVMLSPDAVPRMVILRAASPHCANDRRVARFR